MKPIIICTLFIASLFIAGCTSENEKDLKKIREAEAGLYPDSTMLPDAERAKNIIALYTEYASKYGQDTLSPVFLFKAADMSAKINETAQAISLFGKFTEQYPEHPNAAYALFLQGFIYENQIGDPAKARPYYEKFLEQFPDHPLTNDVRFSLENLGKSPEELIREFESRQQADSTATAAQ
jgi:outer membrane protein assembly factor BamD (BamD/ComL family)